MFFGALLIFPVVVSLIKYRGKAKKAEKELQTYKQYGESMRNLIDNMRAKQHEFDNHINAIYSQHYLYDTYGELVEAQRQYCQEVRNENRFNKLLLAGESVITAFLYEKFLEAEEAGIQISYQIAIRNMECGVPAHKQVELLGNLLDNAVEELRASKDRRRLFVTIRESPDGIEIEVGNETGKVEYERVSRFFEKGYSEKGNGRGYGLYNVKEICKKYGMHIECIERNLEGANFLVFRIVKDNWHWMSGF